MWDIRDRFIEGYRKLPFTNSRSEEHDRRKRPDRACPCLKNGESTMHLLTKLGAASASLAVVAAAAVGMPSASAAGNSSLPVKNLAAKNVKFTEMGGAKPLRTDKTVAHWSGQFTDPTNGVTYGYTMVGADLVTFVSPPTP